MRAGTLLLTALLPLQVIQPQSPPPLASRGSSETTAAVCVLAPRVHADRNGAATALVPVAAPTIFAVGRFAEVQLERQDQLLWRQQASAEGPIEGPIHWPLAPLQPGDRLMLRLRPEGAAPGDFAAIALIAADPTVLERGAVLRRRIGQDPAAWKQAVEAELAPGNLAQAMALLFDFDGPSAPAINALRLEVHARGCGADAVTPQPVPQ
jgi:hypothetical protein